MSPATQHFHRNGNGVCEGTYLKQTQFICHTLVMMLQASLCPTENMQTWRSCSQSPDYPGQEAKLKHLAWLDEHLLTSSRPALAAHLGSYGWNEEYWSARVIEATNIFIGLWYPTGSPQVPDLDGCIRLNGELPWTHSVISQEDETAFGLATKTYSQDIFKIISGKVPEPFPGSGNTYTFVLPYLSADGTKAFTRTPEFHPHGILDKNLVISEITIWKREIITVRDQWNIARVERSSFPPKSVSESIAFRENGIWAGIAIAQRLLCRSAEHRSSFTPPLRQKVLLKHMAKVQWPDIFATGKKYREACTATRATLPSWRLKIQADPSLLEGPETFEGDCVLNRERQAAAVNKKKRGSSSEPESAPSGKAKGKGPADSEPLRGDLRSQSPCASGPLERTPSPTPAGDTSYRSASPAMSPRSQSSRRPKVLSLTVGPAEAPSTAESWADADVAVAEFSIDEDLAA